MRVVALDLPTSWMMATNTADEFTTRMFEAINGMLLDMLAAVARKDYDDRRRRQAQGQAKAKAATRAGRRMRSGMTGSRACSPWGSPGEPSSGLRAAAGRRSRRLPSGKNEPPKPLRVWMEQLGIGRASVYRALA
jgi:DNA invertase Pin-like site-specific DNA recombinase